MSFPPPCSGTYGPGPVLIQRPVVKPWRFGLLSVATVIDETDDHIRNGLVYKSPACISEVAAWADNCTLEDLLVKAPTDADTNFFVQGCPFHLYTALSCKTTTLTEMLPEVQAVFDLGEQRAIEEQVWVNVLAQATTTALNGVGTEYTVVGGFAALESAIAQQYGGEATLWADRGVAEFAKGQHLLYPVGDHLETVLATKFGALGGSPNTGPDGTPAAPGYAWIYITSDLTLRRFPIDINPKDPDQRLRYNPLTNEPYIVAERTYVPSVECSVFAALVCLNAGCS